MTTSMRKDDPRAKSWFVMPAGTGENLTDGAAALPMGPLVRSVFARLNAAGVVWAVQRNYEGLPDYTRYDIDFLVRPRDMRRATALIAEAAREQGWEIIGRQRKHAFTCTLLRSPAGGAGARVQYLPLDLFRRLEIRAWAFADAERVLAARRQRGEGLWVAPPGADAAVTSLKELLRHRYLKENSREGVRRGALEEPEEFRSVLVGRFGAELTEAWLAACQSGDWAAAEALVPRMRSRVYRLTPRNLLAWADLLWKNFAGLFAPSVSAFVVLIGPDGSGKTTIAEGVSRRLYKRPFKACRYLRSNFEILPELKRFKALAGRLIGREVAIAPPPAPGTRHSGMMKPQHPLRSMVYAAYYALDLFLGRLKLRRMRGQWSLIFFDRYFEDYYFQLGYRRLPRWWLRLWGVLAPRPDLAIYLDQDAEAIYARKPELEVGEIRRQQGIIKDLLRGRPEARVIDARGGVEATIEKVAGEIEAHLEAPPRARGRARTASSASAGGR